MKISPKEGLLHSAQLYSLNSSWFVSPGHWLNPDEATHYIPEFVLRQ
jgi:hypothetical protein